jgi:hypothetical protein
MFLKRKALSGALFLLLCVSEKLAAQCTGCTYNVTNNSVPAYTVGVGQKLCIAPGLDYTGTIILNGGVICNQGTLHDITFNKGTFDNYGNYLKSGSVNANTTGELDINMWTNSAMKITGNLSFNALNNSYPVVVTMNGLSMIDIGGSFIFSSGSLKLITSTSPNTKFQQRNVFNVSGQFNITQSASAKINVSNFSSINVFKAMSFDGSGIRQIVNSGDINIADNLNIGGNGRGVGHFNLKNFTNFTVGRSFNISYSNGTTEIENYGSVGLPGVKGDGSSDGVKDAMAAGAADSARADSVSLARGGMMRIGKNYTQGSTNTSFTNMGNFFVEQDVQVSKGVFYNNGYMSARSLTVIDGIFSNSYALYCTGDLTLSRQDAILGNRGYISVGGIFDNDGSVTLERGTALITLDFANRSGASIMGPATVVDKNDFALILISRNSSNSGTIDGYIELVDMTLAQGASYVDARTGNSNIGARTIATITCSKIILGIQVFKMPSHTLLSSPYTVCPGTNIGLKARAFLLVTFTIFSSTITIPVPYSTPPIGSGYAWTYSGITGPANGNPILLSGVTAPFSATVNGVFWNSAAASTCVATASVAVNVSSPIANAGPDQIYSGTPVPIGGTPCSSSSPYTVLWSTSFGFVTGNVFTCNNTVAPSATTNYVLTVTDAFGCTATDNVTVINVGSIISYIVPKKKIDGGYQVPVLNKVYFKFDEEYRSSTVSYKIYDYTTITPNPPANPLCSVTPPARSLGDNRYYIDLNLCLLPASKFYLVEVLNDKNEKFYFKFFN